MIYRGTQSAFDWKQNLQAFVVGSSQLGKFHAGFLSRANRFPLLKILNEKDYGQKNIIFCGHSMGGAIATIVTILAWVEEKKRRDFEEGERRMIR